MVSLSSSAFIISRKFGLQPAEPGVNLKLDTFSRFEKVVNTMIKVGVKLDDEQYLKNGLVAVKGFYDEIRTKPQVKKIKNIGLRERALRCAAQYAYFSVKEYKRRGKIISVFTGLLNSKPDLSLLFNKYFPTNKMLMDARDAIIKAGLDVSVSREFLKNMFRHIRNVLKKMLIKKFSDEISQLVNKMLSSAKIKSNLLFWLKFEGELRLKSFFRKLSTLMTKRVNKILKNNKIILGKGYFDTDISEIIQKYDATIKEWKKARMKWRFDNWKEFKKQLEDINTEDVAEHALSCVSSQLSPARVMNVLFRPKQGLSWVNGTSFNDFLDFLVLESVKKSEILIAKLIAPHLLNRIKELLRELKDCPWKWLKKPQFQKQSIPFGIDDGQVYDLQVKRDQNSDAITDIIAKLSFRPREKLLFKIKTPERFIELVNRGFVPIRGGLTRKTGGGLILIIPFQLDNEDETENCTDTDSILDSYKVGSIDLGLKVFATISIDECKLDSDGNWKKVDKKKGDLIRCFLDQKQLLGKRDKWFLKIPMDNYNFINFKRKLVNLQKVSRVCQSKMKLYANNHPKDYRHKMKYWRLKRKYKFTWRKIKNIHIELIRQIATRSIAFLQHNGTQVLRLEDLSWAKHSGKNEVGYFLSTMQVHWFFAQVQERMTEMAERIGIYVEKADPKDTSNKCCKCGKIGVRSGKNFKCPHCGFQIHSDLNGSRNIMIAPNSPGTKSRWGRRPFPPNR